MDTKLSRSDPWHRTGRVLLAFAVTVVLAISIVWTARTLLAGLAIDHHQFGRAIDYRPDDADAWRDLANAMAVSDQEKALMAARQAVQISPADWQNWKALADEDLAQGHIQQAASDWSKAASRSRSFDAQFGAASFFWVMGNERQFWRRMTNALGILPDNRVQDALGFLIRTGIPPAQWIPLLPQQRPDLLLSAILDLLEQNQSETAALVAQQLHCKGPVESRCQAIIPQISDRLVIKAFEKPQDASALSGQALRDWNQFVAEGVLPRPQAEPGRLLDPHFQQSWNAGAFRWASTRTVYEQVIPGQGPAKENAVEVDFPGDEPDNFEIFRSIMAADGETRYALSLWVRATSGTIPGIVVDLRGSQGVLAQVPIDVPSQWRHVTATVDVPQDAALLNVSIEYHRPAGAMPARGTVQFADVNCTSTRH